MKGRKKIKIAAVNNRDESALLLAGKTGFVTHKYFREVLGVSERRIWQYLSPANKYFSAEEGMINGKTERYYVIDKGGKKKLKELGVENIYKSNSKNHDFKIQSVLLSKQGVNGISSYLSEAELKVRYRNEIEQAKSQKLEISVTDGAYFGTDGRVNLLEVITSSYTKEMIGNKKAFASLIGAEIEFHRC